MTHYTDESIGSLRQEDREFNMKHALPGECDNFLAEARTCRSGKYAGHVHEMLQFSRYHGYFYYSDSEQGGLMRIISQKTKRECAATEALKISIHHPFENSL